MTYIHESAEWPEFRWDAAALNAAVGTVRLAQGRLLGRMSGMEREIRQEASVVSLTSEVVRSSAIEGEVLDAGEVRSSIASRLGLETRAAGSVRREVEGIVEMMLDATQRFDAPLTRERLLSWHTALFPTGRSGLHPITVGAWRRDEAGPMRVVSGHAGQRVHFEAPAATRVEAEMARFLAWFEGGEGVDGVVRAGMAHLWFVTIHPLDDGNGRIARAIADMALARSDASRERYYSMSTQIEREKGDYYRELERQQRGGLDITGWLAWFLGCLERTIEGAEEMLEGVLRKARIREMAQRAGTNERQMGVVERLLAGFEGPLTSSKYAKLARCSADTAQRDIKELVAYGVLVRNEGGGRSTSYRLVDAERAP